MLQIGYWEQVPLVLSELCLRRQPLDVERVGFLTTSGSALLGAWTDGYISSLHYSPVSLSLASQPSYVLIDGKWRRTRFVRFNHFGLERSRNENLNFYSRNSKVAAVLTAIWTSAPQKFNINYLFPGSFFPHHTYHNHPRPNAPLATN